MGVEHLVFDDAYYTGDRSTGSRGYGGYGRGIYAEPRPGNLLARQGYGAEVAQGFIDRGFDPAGTNVLVLGAGPGYLVKHLREDHGVLAWGMENAAWPLANEVTGGYMLSGDVTNTTDLDAAETAAGVNRWDAIITELLIVCWDDPTILTAAAEWRVRATNRPALDWSGVIHIVHTHDVWDYAPHLGATWDPDHGWSGPQDQPYRQRSLVEWQTFLDADLGGGDRPDWVWE
jgi:hypothetical protein